MGRKTGKKKRGAEKNTVPKRAPLRDVAVFNGTFVLQLPEGWRRRQTEATCLSEILAVGVLRRLSWICARPIFVIQDCPRATSG